MAVVILVTLQLTTIAKIDSLSLDLTKETIQHDSVETVKRDTVLYSLELPDIYSHTIPTVPDNTKIFNQTMELDKRNYVWYVLTAIKTARQGFAMKGLIESCRDWSKDGASGKADCVWGAIDTALTLGMLATSGWEAYVAIGAWMALGGDTLPGVTKRDNILGYWKDAEHPLQSIIANSTGLPVATLQYSNGSYVLNDQTGWPVHAVWSNSGSAHLVSLMENQGSLTAIRVGGFDTGLQKRDEQFNLENFSSGGIESYCDRWEDGIAALDVNNDFGTLDHQVSCAFDLNSHEYEWNVHDFNNGGAIGAGKIAAFQYSTYDGDELKNYLELAQTVDQRCRVA